jgi:hypothetical protein
MISNIYFNKRGILRLNPLWISLNSGKYKLCFSSIIQISTTQRENTIKLRDIFFIFSKKLDIKADKPSIFLNIKITPLDQLFRIGVLIISLFCISYVIAPFTFIPIQLLFYILFGFLVSYTILLLIFKRKDYFKVEMVNE